jgi:hypothetical protein
MPILFYAAPGPYEAPEGSSVNFTFEGGYTPPEGDDVDFIF